MSDNKLADFNAEILARLLDAKLINKTPNSIELRNYLYGAIELYDNGGEINLYFENLRKYEIDLPQGLTVSRISFDFSIPYTIDGTNCSVTEFANRLKFFLERADNGVQLLDYFQQPKVQASLVYGDSIKLFIASIVTKDGTSEYNERVLVQMPEKFMQQLRLLYFKYAGSERVSGFEDEEWYWIDNGEKQATVHYLQDVLPKDWAFYSDHMSFLEITEEDFYNLAAEELEVAKKVCELNQCSVDELAITPMPQRSSEQ